MVDDQAQSMREFYDQHGEALLAYATGLTGDRAAAQDLVRESMLRAQRTPRAIDGSEVAARAWLFDIARRIANDEWRTGRARHAIPAADEPAAAPFDELDVLLPSWQIVEALSRLSVQHRQALVECYYRGRTVVQAAAALGVPENTIKTHLHYALRALQLTLAEMGVMDGG